MHAVQQLADRMEMADLVARIGYAQDDRDTGPEVLRGLYTEDVVVETVRGTLRGLDSVVTHLARARTGAADERTQHLNTDVRVDLAGDRAEVTVQQLVHFFRPGAAPHRTAGVRCAYRAVRTDAGWRFARAEFAPLWIEGEPVPGPQPEAASASVPGAGSGAVSAGSPSAS